MLLPVILSGGSGSRLWPVSRKLHPKQFIRFNGDGQSMLQQTALRVAQLEASGSPLIICNQEHRFLVAEQLREIEQRASAILLEPVGRNTAPAAALAAFWGLQNDPDCELLVLPSDHHIPDREAFSEAVGRARGHANAGKLVTFGIQPRTPETGYGYIQRGIELEADCAWSVAHFVEKPDLKKAIEHVESGEYFWNSGIFLFRADRYLEELKARQPEMYRCCEQACAALEADLDFTRIPEDPFTDCPSDSIDYAVMEQTRDAVVVAFVEYWSDAGSWNAMWDLSAKDESGNVLHGDVALQGAQNCYVHGEDRLVAALGTENLAIIDTPDALLVASMEHSQQVKHLVEQLSAQNREETQLHKMVMRPWGSYETLVEGPRFKVKRIIVKDGASLSLQMHHHRAEHWVVVRGTAEVQRGEETFLLSEDESTYIPVGTKHRLANPGKIELEIIEVQSGSYVGEDDITRMDDRYGR